MDELTLKKEAYALKVALSTSLLNDIDSVEFVKDYISDQFHAIVRGNLFCKDAGIFKYKVPASWIDHLKQSSRLVRIILGDPEYKVVNFFVRVTLDPSSYRVVSSDEFAMIPLSESEFHDVYNSREYIEVNEMKFYPIIYKME